MAERLFNALFLCTGNSARSILAEALLSRLGAERFRAFSAGSQPKPQPHPLALDLLRERGHDVSSLRSKSWDEFVLPSAPALDFVFSVCDNAAREACPVWPGQPITAHWGIEDPAAVAGDEAGRRRAFRRAYAELEARIEAFTSLPLEELDRVSLLSQLREIGEM